MAYMCETDPVVIQVGEGLQYPLLVVKGDPTCAVLQMLTLCKSYIVYLLRVSVLVSKFILKFILKI